MNWKSRGAPLADLHVKNEGHDDDDNASDHGDDGDDDDDDMPVVVRWKQVAALHKREGEWP